MVAKNKVHRSMGTYFMHIRVKTKEEILDDETRNLKVSIKNKANKEVKRMHFHLT